MVGEDVMRSEIRGSRRRREESAKRAMKPLCSHRVNFVLWKGLKATLHRPSPFPLLLNRWLQREETPRITSRMSHTTFGSLNPHHQPPMVRYLPTTTTTTTTTTRSAPMIIIMMRDDARDVCSCGTRDAACGNLIADCELRALTCHEIFFFISLSSLLSLSHITSCESDLRPGGGLLWCY